MANRHDLAKMIALRSGLRPEVVEVVLRELPDALAELVRDNSPLMVQRLGSFRLDIMGARKGRNPATGAQITIRARRVLRFRPAKHIRTMINARKDQTKT